MRLIDADGIDFKKVFGGESEFAKDMREAAQMLVDKQPTAYDVDKVVEMLEEECFSPIDYPGYAVDIEKAIEIVEEGGVDGGKRGKSEDAEELRSNSEATSKWVPCSERLPENAMNVIAQFSSGTVTELRYAGNGIFEGIYEYSTKVIIAWMPLPEPYREVR